MKRPSDRRVNQIAMNTDLQSMAPVLDLLVQALIAAEQKHPGWPEDPVHAAGILAEEAGETLQAAIDYFYRKGPAEELAKPMIHEAAQCGAMCLRFLYGLLHHGYQRNRSALEELDGGLGAAILGAGDN